jgi:hypothetical protein
VKGFLPRVFRKRRPGFVGYGNVRKVSERLQFNRRFAKDLEDFAYFSGIGRRDENALRRFI